MTMKEMAGDPDDMSKIIQEVLTVLEKHKPSLFQTMLITSAALAVVLKSTRKATIGKLSGEEQDQETRNLLEAAVRSIAAGADVQHVIAEKGSMALAPSPAEVDQMTKTVFDRELGGDPALLNQKAIEVMRILDAGKFNAYQIMVILSGVFGVNIAGNWDINGIQEHQRIALLERQMQDFVNMVTAQVQKTVAQLESHRKPEKRESEDGTFTA